MTLGIRRFLVLAFLAVSGMPILVFLLWPYTSILDQKRAEVRERHLLIADSLGAALEVYHDDIIAAMESFSVDIARNAAIQAKPIFENLHFRHVCVADAQTGRILVSYLDTEFGCPSRVSDRLFALFQDMSSNGQVGVSGVFAPDGDTPRIFVVKAVGSVLVVGAIHTTFFKDQQRRIKFGTGGHAAIVDAFGRVLAHPVTEWEDTAHDLSDLDIVQAMISGRNGVMSFVSPATEQEMIAGFHGVEGANWGVMVPQPVRELELAAQGFNRDVTLILLAGLAVSLLMAFAIAQKISNRIAVVHGALETLGAGRLDVDLPQDVEAINISELRGLEGGVQTLARDLDAMRTTHDSDSRELEQSNARLKREADERAAAESELRDSSLRYRSLFESVPVAIREEDLSDFKAQIDALKLSDFAALSAYLDENPKFIETCGHAIRMIDANTAAIELHGYTDKSELMSTALRSFGPESRVFLRRTIEAVFSGQTRMAHESAIYRKDGKRRDLMSTWSVVPGHETDYSRILLTSIDMTDRFESEKALRQAQKMEAVGQLTGGVAHDFNNLLTVVSGNAELLALSSHHDQDLVEPILRAAQRGAELTQRLLAFSRIQPLQPQSIDIGGLASGLLDMLRRTLGPSIEVVLQAEPDLFAVRADTGQVEAALLNLVLNARDAMEHGGTLTITCRSARPEELDELDVAPGEYAALVISDTGTGMTTDTLNRAVEPFFTTKDVGKGSGLGLSMVYGFARQSKGATRIRSTVGKGSEISLFLPRATKVAHSTHIKNAVAPKPTQQGFTILILEDDADVLNYLNRLVRALGYDTCTAMTPAEVHSLVQSGASFDLLLSDVMLPGAQVGPDVAQDLRKERPDLPVVFVSGYPDAAETRIGMELQDAVWIKKPFSPTELSKALRSLLSAA